MPGRRRWDISQIDHRTTSEFVHDLLVRELNAELVPNSDKTVPAQWAPPLEKKEEPDMGLFDIYKNEGMDLGEVKLDPYAIKDGTYEVAFAGGEIVDPTDDKWDPAIQFDYIFIANGDGSPTEYKDRRYPEKMRYPQTIMHDDDDKVKAAKKAIDRIAQRMYSLGITDPTNADLKDINKLKGTRYIVRLTTGTAKDENSKPPQWFNILTKKKSDTEATKDFFDQD